MSELPIELQDVSKWYGKVVGLVRASLGVEPGITGLLGPNGAGKSTLLKLVTGQLRPSLGRVLVFGRPVWEDPRARRRVGFAPEVDAFHESLDARRFVRLMAGLAGLSRRVARRRTEEVLELTGMLEYASVPLRNCSKGMRQRVKIAQAVAHDPDVVILDEPLNGIDPAGRRELLDTFTALRDEGKSLVISSHILHEIETVTDRMVLIAKGRVLAAGPLARIRDVLSEYPLTVRVRCARRREVAASLVAEASVQGVRDAGDPCEEIGDLIVLVTRPQELFLRLPRLLRSLDVEVERFEALDDSAEAVFNYLVSGREAATGRFDR